MWECPLQSSLIKCLIGPRVVPAGQTTGRSWFNAALRVLNLWTNPPPNPQTAVQSRAAWWQEDSVSCSITARRRSFKTRAVVIKHTPRGGWRQRKCCPVSHLKCLMETQKMKKKTSKWSCWCLTCTFNFFLFCDFIYKNFFGAAAGDDWLQRVAAAAALSNKPSVKTPESYSGLPDLFQDTLVTPWRGHISF